MVIFRMHPGPLPMSFGPLVPPVMIFGLLVHPAMIVVSFPSFARGFASVVQVQTPI